MTKKGKKSKKEKCKDEVHTCFVYYNNDELIEYMEELDLNRDTVSEGKLRKMAAKFYRQGKRDRGVNHKDYIRRGLEACRALLECLEAGVQLPALEEDCRDELGDAEPVNMNAQKRKARKMRKRREERERRNEKFRRKIQHHEKLKQKYEKQERKAQKWFDIHEKNREARLRRETKIVGEQRAREAEILRDREVALMNRYLRRLKELKEKSKGQIEKFGRRLKLSDLDLDSNETESSCDEAEDLDSDDDWNDEFYYRAFIYDDEQYDSCDDGEDKPAVAFKSYPGGLRERFPLWKYKELPDEYNGMRRFLSYEMEDRSFRNNGCGKIYDRLAYNALTMSEMCSKLQTKIYVDWLFEEQESTKVAISQALLERIWRERGGMICKIKFPNFYTPDDRIQPNTAITLSRGSIELMGMIEEVYVLHHFMYISFNVRTTKEKGDFLRERDYFDVFVESSMFSQTSALRAVDLAIKHCYGSVLFPQEDLSVHEPYASELNSLEFDEDSHFNPTQKRAIYEIVRGYSKNPFVLFGPPGTGKTTVLVESISQILTENPNARILICAPSGRAADVVGERILAKKVIRPEFIFRLNSLYAKVKERNRKLDEIAKFVNPKAAAAMAETQEGEFAHFFSGYEIPRLSVLKRYRIIISTLAASSYLVSGKMPRSHFTHIFIDEAGQSTEPETWIPISGLSGKSTRIILCGDPKQLGPISSFKIAQSLDCNRSMLERLFNLPHYKKSKSFMVTLKDAYRCHPEILRLPSTMFYDGKLEANKDDNRSEWYHRLAKWPELPKPGFPLIFYSVTSGVEEQTSTSSSFFNLAEVERVARYVRLILHEELVSESDIGVISPYKLQTEKLREELRAYKEIVVDSVERFQGSERRIIIMTTVRTRDIGFLASEQRFNTAVTRAQNLLIVVGNANALQKNRTWQKWVFFFNSEMCDNERKKEIVRFIEYCAARGGFLME